MEEFFVNLGKLKKENPTVQIGTWTPDGNVSLVLNKVSNSDFDLFDKYDAWEFRIPKDIGENQRVYFDFDKNILTRIRSSHRRIRGPSI